MDLLGFDIDGDSSLGRFVDEFGEGTDVSRSGTNTRHSEGSGISEENFGEGLCDDGAEARSVDGLRSVLTGRAASEVCAGKDNAGPVESGVIQRVIGLLSSLGIVLHVVEHAFREVVEGDALHETGRNDAVSIDIDSWDGNGGAADLGDFWKCHLALFLLIDCRRGKPEIVCGKGMKTAQGLHGVQFSPRDVFVRGG